VGEQGSTFRQLRFESIDAALAEARALVAGESRGELVSCGQWTLGQALGHLSTWIGFCYEGFPRELRMPWILRVVMKTQKRRMTTRAMPRGVRIPGVAGGTLGVEPSSTAEGLARFEAACARLRREAPTQASPLLGAMTHEEWTGLHLRHAELHMGMFSVRAG
jgi:hypothetical protein